MSGRGFSLKAIEQRTEAPTFTTDEHTGRLRSISRVTWASVFRRLRRPRAPPSALGDFQQRLHVNSDTVVATLELAIILMSCVQLELSSRFPHWRENKVCARLSNCIDMKDEGSFVVSNSLRGAIGALGLVRMWVRVRFLAKQRHNVPAPGLSWFKRTTACRLYLCELLALLVFPYPGLETILKHSQADIMVYLSIAVGVRSICWRHIMYFPYPIRQKSKIASFSGNLEFSYREFVFKKVMDDHPIRKLVLVSTILLVFTTFLVRSIETIDCVCAPLPEFAARPAIGARHLECASMSWGDASWFVSTSFLMLGFGDVVPKSKAARLVVVVSSCVMRCLAAMLASVFIKKSNFSTMEARVHAFLHRMDLFSKKDLSAVMAVQATFRFTKSYRHSLVWHKHQSTLLYFRPLSARLPNEVKKKLCVSRFQSSLKDIMRFNTDGDPMNAFAKHTEVITAALGNTLVEMAHLKKISWRKSRLLEKTQKIAVHDNSDLPADQAKPCDLLVSITGGSPPPTTRQFECRSQTDQRPSSEAPSAPSFVAVSSDWGQSMLLRCQHVLTELKHIEANAKTIGLRDFGSSFEGAAT